MADRLTAPKLAARLGVSYATILAWYRRGMPHELTPSGHPRFDEDACRAWYAVERKAGRLTAKLIPSESSTEDEEPAAAGSAETYSEANTRWKRAQADAAELKVRAESGELVRAEDVRMAVGDLLFNLRRRVLGLPDRVAPTLVGRSRVEIADTLLGDLIALLGDCAENPYDDRSETGEVGSGPRPDGGGVPTHGSEDGAPRDRGAGGKGASFPSSSDLAQPPRDTAPPDCD